jgi:SAM-dependent methyltransferase
MSHRTSFTEANRRAWNEIAEARSSIWPGAEFFARGGSLLGAAVTEAAGDVRGKNLLHLQCATGEETLSWANAGANVTGTDISEQQIAIARRKAADAGITARFVAADLYSLSPDLQSNSFDIVYTGGGAVVWLPDLQEWARIIFRALRPGGRLILAEEHPVAGVMQVEDGVIRIEDDYFRRATPIRGTGWTHFPGGEGATEQKAEFLWPLGDIVTSLIEAGLPLDRLEEFPSDAEWRFGEQLAEARRLPGSYVLVASKT